MLILPIEQAEAGVKLAMGIYHPESPETELLKAGYVCDSEVLNRLRDLGITSLFVDYPGFEDLDRFLAPQLSPVRQTIYSHIKNTIAAVEKTARPTVTFPDYYAATRDLVITLLQHGDNAFYLEQLSTRLPEDEVSHATAVAHLALMLGLRLETYLIQQRSRLNPQHAREVVNLGVAGMLHDIGKTRLPEKLRVHHQLHVPDEEGDCDTWESHVQLGFEMVRHGIEASASAAILQHHQRFDGEGFPELKRGNKPAERLSGNDIHIFARIIAAANLFDRLALDRKGHRKPNVVVLHRMRNYYRSWVDPEIVEAMASVVPPFPPGLQVELSDGSRAVVVDLDHRQPYQPRVRRVSDGIPVPEGDAIDLRRTDELWISAVDGIDVTAMYPHLAAA